MAVDLNTMVSSVGVHCLIIESGLRKARSQVKERAVPDVYKQLTGTRCLAWNANTLVGWNKIMGIGDIQENLKTIATHLELVELYCKEISNLTVIKDAEEVVNGYGKSVSEINQLGIECIALSKKKLEDLTDKLIKVDCMMAAHLEYRLFADEVTLLLGQCQGEEFWGLTGEEVNALELAADLLAERRVKLKENMTGSCAIHFSKGHTEEEAAISVQFQIIRRNLEEAKQKL